MNLVQILFAFVISYIKGGSPVKDLNSVMNPSNQAAALKTIPGLAPHLKAYNSGEEIDWAELSDLITRFRKAYLTIPDAKSSYADVLGAFASWFKTGSVGAFKKLEKVSTQVADPSIPAALTKDSVDQGPVKDKLLSIVKKLGGTGHALTMDESKKAKLKKPDLYKDYLALRRQYTESWKTALSNYVRGSGHTTVPMIDVAKHFENLGIEDNMAKGFTGRIDASGAWYTSDGKLINGVPNSTMFPTVRMNPNKNSALVFHAVRPDGNEANAFYTAEHNINQAQEKFAKVANFDPDKFKGQWRTRITNFDYYDSRDVAAVVIELLYRSSNRIGTPGGNASGGGFGIATLLKKHYYPQTDGGFKFIYLGKDNVKFTVRMMPTEDAIAKKICEIVKEMAKDKRPNMPLFTYWLKSGSPKPLTLTVVRELFRSITGLNVHKLRTWKGTKIFREYLANVFSKRTNVDLRQAMDLLRKGAILVGKELNHVKRTPEGVENVTPSTAIKNYIDPEAQAELFQHYNLPLPSYIEKLLGQSTLSRVMAASDNEHPEMQPVKPVKPAEAVKPVAPVKPAAPVHPTHQYNLPKSDTQPTPDPVPQPTPPPVQPQPVAPLPQVPPQPMPQPEIDEEEDEEPVLDSAMDRYLSGESDVWEEGLDS